MKKREVTATQATGLLEQLRIGRAEARVRVGTESTDVVRAIELGTRGDGSMIDVSQERITNEKGELTDVEVVARRKAG